MMKRVDVAAYTVCEQVLNDEFTGGTLVFKLSNEGVGIPTDNPNLTDEWIATIGEYADQVVAGDFVVPEVPERVK